MDEDDLYDEFGNLINEPVDSEASSASDSEEEVLGQTNGKHPKSGSDDSENDDAMEEVESSTVALYEDKQFYPSMSETFGPDVETIIATSDEQDINVPIVAPIEEKVFKIEEKELPTTTYSKEYMVNISNIPSRVRNIVLAGNLHTGKTSLVDALIAETHDLKLSKSLKTFKPPRYTDNHILEVERGCSVKMTPVTLLLEDLSDASMVVNIMDAPGHVNFSDELAVAARLADSVVLVIDVVEGLQRGEEIAIEHALQHKLPILLVINKIDRLVLELRIPPADAYLKIRHTIDEVNEHIQKSGFLSSYPHNALISPSLGNVCFASSTLQFCFSLRSFAKLYNERLGVQVDTDAFAKRLWGDVYYEATTRRFTKKPANTGSLERSFVSFILKPLYKVITISLSKDPKELNRFLKKSLNINSIPKATLELDPQIFLKDICGAFFGRFSAALVDMIEKHAPSPEEAASYKLSDTYTGPESGIVSRNVLKCDPEGPLIAYVAKLVDTSDAERFYAVVRVLSGTLKANSQIVLLGETYTDDFDEDLKDQDAKKTFYNVGRYKIPVAGIPAGSIGLVSGRDIDSFITKTATIYDMDGIMSDEEPIFIFKPLNYIFKPVLKVAIQPVNPSDLPKFTAGLKKINRSYVGCEVRVEESGEHVVLGSGELYMDCLLHDLRKLYTDIEIKVSDPMTKLAETCVESSFVKITVDSSNKKNKMSIIAEPLDPKIGEDIENGKISQSQPTREISKFFRNEYGWDSLAARSIWAFGSDENGSTILLDDTLPDEVDKKRLNQVKDFIIQGFKWATREGPLCDEPIRYVAFKIMSIDLSPNSIESNGAQIIQMTRNACYAALMTSSPKLLEPVYQVDITCTTTVAEKLSGFLDKRRGSIVRDYPIGGTPLYKVIGYVPVIDSVGLETDIRLLTQGQAMCLFTFEKWQLVPGNPLDRDAFIPVLKRAPVQSLARDFTTKTRKRKGIDGEPSLEKYIDEELIIKLKESGIIDG
ncbi:unnamed protein product [Kuraishia capsulata CBS 1993]|uniref:Tr-type G domain-containing protein n=1 Tax=Kuraishia capsulata CBS 1993 TaxID=1382522 RepID=W6MUF0_9ASCO|nr:uncharacterized protein KUCA_T00001540001 [Kuraishia capsulata CBS 1993]CDK25570.1 unnamed protein product [Kuraishia capsulata CBS 1993]